MLNPHVFTPCKKRKGKKGASRALIQVLQRRKRSTEHVPPFNSERRAHRRVQGLRAKHAGASRMARRAWRARAAAAGGVRGGARGAPVGSPQQLRVESYCLCAVICQGPCRAARPTHVTMRPASAFGPASASSARDATRRPTADGAADGDAPSAPTMQPTLWLPAAAASRSAAAPATPSGAVASARGAGGLE